MSAETKWAIVPISRTHDRSAFACGVPDLDTHLARYARQNEDLGFGRTYVAVRPGNPRVLGYFTLRTGEFDVSLLPEEIRRKFPKYAVPVIHLGRLAVDRSVQRQGLGEHLLLTALRIALEVSRQVGASAVEVVAIDDTARRFYVHYGFKELVDDRNHLYLRMNIVAELLSDSRS